MKQILYAVLGALVLIAAGFVTISFVQSQTGAIANQETTIMPTVLPTALVGFPDIEHIPIYPNASVSLTNTEPTGVNDIAYIVRERVDKIYEFYQQMLPKEGWVLRTSGHGRNLYSWTDPAGKLLWEMYLEVVIEPTLDQSKTLVDLNYGRYPNTEVGLPLYPDAQKVSATRTNTERTVPSGSTPVRVTEITYLSSSGPREIAAFYTNSMQEYGWVYQGPGWSTDGNGVGWPFDDPGLWEGNTPREGLYFCASHLTWGEKSGVVAYQLLATATLRQDGLVMIKLHVEESESSLGNF